MEFLNVLKERYSVRGFENKEVEADKLDKILEAGINAPTGVNFQPFQIFVIDTEENKQLLSEMYPQPWFVEAPIILGVAVKPADAWVRKFDDKNIADMDGTIVMDHMILEATSLGLGTCYIGAFKPEKAKELLNLSDEYEPLLFSPLGYPNAKPRDTPRKSKEELVKFI
ncbi:nitroreductase family protein [Methanobrevibacter sp. DSM 116169]|uniref:nitroreductase family protein n=1 Tax=Methanobrevibacter sp. DSM 116169 TaxID=3242727 RepID=UPI0038FC53D6